MIDTYKIKAKVKCTLFYNGNIFSPGDDFECNDLSEDKLKTLRDFLEIKKLKKINNEVKKVVKRKKK